MPPHADFVQQDPIEGEPATEKTEVRILVGRGQIYVGIICFDSDPSRIIVSQARRDAALTDTDAVILVFDTFNDSQNAFVFGTNPLGIEYDGQVAGEGQTGGTSFQSGSGGTGGSQRGGISAFNPNWDGDWTVRSAITDRGWEAEIAIPLKTLRYETGDNRTWGFNVMRNIRRKNEQVYLAAIPRGFDIYRVSMAAKLTGLDLPARRDIKLIPYALALGEQGLRTAHESARSQGRCGPRREVGRHAEHDAWTSPSTPTSRRWRPTKSRSISRASTCSFRRSARSSSRTRRPSSLATRRTSISSSPAASDCPVSARPACRSTSPAARG